MKYFAYGSNMSLSRLSERIADVQQLGSYILRAHDLRFHKAGSDGSAKCDAFYTQNPDDYIIGSLYEISPSGIKTLDQIEGLGDGYNKKDVTVEHKSGTQFTATTYYAMHIDITLKPFSWYKNHVLVGARELQLPEAYIKRIETINSIDDPNTKRDAQQRDLHK
ncbi:MAG: gamma-glutamylcyclotransferase [Pseudomonadales bacterium]|nr:gamma-glutamylcyclotransferase [Pseudomonadales bacterium]